jgi:hypothetical protein
MSPTISQGRQFLTLPLPRQDGFNDAQTTDPGDVAQHLVQLHIHLLERLLHVLTLNAARAHQLIAVAQIRAQHAHRIDRAKRGVEQTVTVQTLQPLAVQHITLSPRHILDLSGVDQPHRKTPALQHLKGRNPVNARRFHRHRPDAALPQPIGHPFQIFGERAKGPHGPLAPVTGHRAPMLPMPNVNPCRVGLNHRQGVEADFCPFLLLILESSFHTSFSRGAFGPRVAIQNAVF